MNHKQEAEKIVEMFSDYSNPYRRGDSGFLEFSTKVITQNAIQCAIKHVEALIEMAYTCEYWHGWNNYNEILHELKSM